MRVVPALHELEYLHARLGLGAEPVASEELALQRGEALTKRVVVAIPDRAHGGPHSLAPADARKFRTTHQPGDALAAHTDSLSRRLGMDSRPRHSTPGTLVDRLNAFAERPIGAPPGTRRAPAPRVAPAGGDAQHPAYCGRAIHGSVRPDALVDPDGIESVSRANQAAAFAKISRSWPSCRFSRQRLELAREFLGRASRPDQLNQPAPELHRITWMSLRHCEHLLYAQIIRCPSNRVNSIILITLGALIYALGAKLRYYRKRRY